MKSNYLLIIIIFISAALGLGWFFDKQPADITSSSLEVPDNIDYYLSNLKYRSMNQQGSVHYLLNSPYLEHYIQQNISHLKQPDMQFYGDKSEWIIQAETGRLYHIEEQFELEHQVKLTRSSKLQPMLLTTSLMILKAQKDLIEVPQAMHVTTKNAKLQAASAVLSMDQNQYHFKGVSAIYKPNNLNRSSNGQS